MKKSQKSLRDWTNQKWRTSDGSPSKGKKRYLPDAAWKALTPGEKAATNRAKAKSDKQFVNQPKNIAKKTAKYRAMGGLISKKFQNGGQLPKTPYDVRSTDILLPGAKEPSTVLMESGGYDNKEYAYPTLFPKDPTNPTNNPKDWMQLSGEAAFMEAQKRGELWEFPTAEEADSYARGSWKTKPQQKQMGGTLPYVAPNDLLEVEITPENTELKDQPKELESYYRDYAAQYPVTDKKDITKQYREGVRNYAAEQLLKENPQGDRNRKDYLKSFTEQELAVLRNSKSKGKVNPTLMQKFEGALKQGAAAGAPGDLRYKKVETESLTDEEMKDVGALDLLGPLSIPAKLVQAGYKDGYSLLDALKGQENDASLIEEIATDPLNLVGIGLVSKGANAAKLLKAYKNLSKLNNTKRASTLQNAIRSSGPTGKYNRVVGEDAIEDMIQSDLVRVNDKAGVATDLGPFGIANRTTPYPSFGAAPPQQRYIDRVISQGKTPYVISTDRPMKASNLGRHGKGSTMFPISQEGKYISGFPVSEAQVYKVTPQGYEKIEVPTLNERLRNNPSYVINPEVRSTEKLAKESEPYLKSSTPPGSKQDEIVEGFAPGLRQERIEKTTVNFNPDGSVMSQEKAMGGALDKSIMGYRDDSPYKNEPYLDINTPTGEIDMSETGVSLYANGKLLKPYSGKHKFNTSKVREVPVNNSWLDKYK